ncbi:MAG TPA: hypothetical protein VEB69_12760 [Acidimicrobiia bacterium]|nr:hypothetical protein [Acidimicrobiia bacterium]
MSWQLKALATAGVLIAGLSMGDILAPPWGLLVVLTLVILLWRMHDGFLKTLVGGLVGGAAAGILILGPGFRVAMRAVALMDQARPEEFTVGGTLFIVVGIGAVLGGLNGAIVNLVRKAFGIRSAVVGGLMLATTVMVNLTFFSGDVSRELFDLGISPWINIPLFSVVALGYGIAAMAIAELAERAMFERRDMEKEKVPA